MLTQLGHYRLMREAGRGGMSTVFEAVDTRLGRTVALKVLSVPVHLSAEQREHLVKRFEREARAIGSLSHPNVVTIYDVGEQDGYHFLVMEYLDGVTLRARMDTGPVSPEEAAHILDGVAAGLDAIHAQGIVHRDVKPGNVMLLPDNRVKLMDFGVARQPDDTTVTQAGMTVGSPAYMAPEQVRGETGTPASDLWAVGVLIYEMLAGRPPFTAENIPSVLYQVAHQDPAPLPGAAPAREQVIRRALAKDPARRYASARELAVAFRDTLPPPSPPPPVPAPARIPAPPRQPAPPVGAKGVAVTARRSPPRGVPLSLIALALIAGTTAYLFGRSLQMRGETVATAVRPDRTSPSPPTTKAQTEVAATPPVGEPEMPERAARRPEAPAAVRIDEAEPVPRQERSAARGGTPARTARPTRPAAEEARPTRRAPDDNSESRVAKRTTEEPRPRPARRRASETRESSVSAAAPAALAAPRPAASTGRSLLGSWQGTHTGSPATLRITDSTGNVLSGTLTVRAGGNSIRLAVRGEVAPRTGAVTLRETRVLAPRTPRVWDLGVNTGRLTGEGRMEGSGRDARGRRYTWSFSR